MDQKTSLPSQPASPSRELVLGQGLEQFALEKAGLMFGCYRKGDANNPEIYTAAIAATLAEFSPEVIEFIADPRTGLPAKCKFLPTVAEVREACESRKEYLVAAKKLEAAGYVRNSEGGWVKP